MGTLRYMSPEQARGRVDHRSDIFSVGAVFYELLAYRPAFDRQDPIELLEQIRSGDPPPLTEVEPSVPPELAAIIERALRKDPVQRLRDLAQMRDQLQRVLRALERNRDQSRNRVRGKLAEVGALQAAVLALLGTPADEDTIPLVDDRMGLAQLVDLDQQLDDRLARLRARLAEAEAGEPAVTRALALLEGGEFAAAITRIRSRAPRPPRSRTRGPRAARREGGQEAHWAAQLEADHRLGEAAALLEEGEPARCLEVLDVLAPQTLGAARAGRAEDLRRAAQATLAAQAAEAERRAARRRGARAPRLRSRSWRAHGVRPRPQPR
jgi:hypothetical protein